MKIKKIFATRILVSSALVLSMFAQLFNIGSVYASQITARSLTLLAGTTDGGSKPGGVVKHSFAFTLPGGNTVGSIKFEYCTLAAGLTCTTPTGLVTTSATLGSETGVTGTSIVNTTNGAPYLTRTAAAVSTNTNVTYRLDSITNPTTVNYTFFVRISTFANTTATGSALDIGTVTASTADPVILSGTMPESLVFCTGKQVLTTGGVPDCATATTGTITFNQLFSPTDTASATSQMAASTNAGSGYAITVNGPTLTSGANTITAINAAAAGVRGVSQFGINLKLNTTSTTTLPVGTEIAPVSNGTNYRAEPKTGYDSVDTFKFVTGDVVADSGFNALGATDAQIYTASYIVNVPGSQAAGTYTTTLTYICTPKF
jgi:hypothetical protein